MNINYIKIRQMKLINVNYQYFLIKIKECKKPDSRYC